MQLALYLDVLLAVAVKPLQPIVDRQTSTCPPDLRPCAAAAASTSGASAVRRRRLCGFPAPAHQPRRSALPAAQAPGTSPWCSGGARAERAASRSAARSTCCSMAAFESVVVRSIQPSSDSPQLRRIPAELDRLGATAARDRRRRHTPHTELLLMDRPRTWPRRPSSGLTWLRVSIVAMQDVLGGDARGAAGQGHA